MDIFSDGYLYESAMFLVRVVPGFEYYCYNKETDEELSLTWDEAREYFQDQEVTLLVNAINTAVQKRADNIREMLPKVKQNPIKQFAQTLCQNKCACFPPPPYTQNKSRHIYS